MKVSVEKTAYCGWPNCWGIGNGEVELVVTADVGPRVIHFGFVGARNVFGVMKSQLGKTGEKEWQIRGGHRFWIAPELKPRTYELDNKPVFVRPIPGGVRAVQPPGPISGVQKILELVLDDRRNEVTVRHILRNAGHKPVELSPWALTVMAKRGMAIIPLPEKISHSARLTHNQEWSLWGYTDFGDARWTLGSRFVFFRQNPRRGPNKLGMAHREGWVAYLLDDCLFVKRFGFVEGARYPDGGVNFETFSNEDFLELESLGPLTSLPPGGKVQHRETWQLFRGVGSVKSESDVLRRIVPLAACRTGKSGAV